MNAAIDFGNTTTKLAVFDENALLESYQGLSDAQVIDIIQKEAPEHIVISSVSIKESIIEALKSITHCLVVDNLTHMPITIDYRTPTTLGIDRMASAVAAYFRSGGKTALVIDAGTRITLDIIDANGHYKGGSISPGMDMRFSAMSQFTAHLPLVKKPSEAVPYIGDTTESSIQSGVVNGISAEIEQNIQRYLEIFPDLQVYITGGDSNFFESMIKASIFVIPELVLEGLNRILHFNVAQKS